MKRYIKFLGKALISFFFLFLVFKKLDFNTIIIELKQINIIMLFLSIILYLSTMIFSTIRWSYFVKTKKSIKELFQLYMIGTFFNLFMPGTVGGDVIKAYYLYKEDRKKTNPLVSVFMERYMGLCALITIALIGFFFGYDYIKDSLIDKLFYLICALFILGTLFVLFFPYEKFYHKLDRARESIKNYMFNPSIFFRTYILSLIVQGIGVLVVYFLGIGLSIPLQFKFYLIFIPIITVISMIPISLSGFGVREYGFLYLLSIFGISKEKAVGLSLMWFFTMLMTGLVGMFFYLNKKVNTNVDIS
ncbi:MAG: flippase-like domain-containing protein [Proteobacteria bacterium]|nr:flippase-like domain-containing protein [Pseudomonadota bacterium]